MFRTYHIRNFNIRLVLLVMALTIIGVLVIGSANETYQSRQTLGLLLGMVTMIGASLVNYTFILGFYRWIYALVIVVLSSVLFFGDSAGGATRWIDFGIVRFQPSEIAKILLILFFANYLMEYREEINTKKHLAIIAVLLAIPLLLIVREPDLSTTIVTFLMILAMLFYSGLSYKIVGGFFLVGLAGAGFVIFRVLSGAESILMSYQGDRIQAWLKPEEFPQISYQQQNSIMAIGSGQLLGKGLYNTGVDSVKNGNYISEGQTDFIFAVAGEELGFVGSCVIILIMFFIAYECIRTSKKAKDFAGEVICIGMAMLIFIQSFVNIGVVTGLLPNTGLTLPFISYGLTSLVTLFLGIGIVLNISLQARKY